MQRPTPALMIQATGSNAGKSTIVAGLARALVRRGLKVAPFKPQNMSNNAAVAIEGGEIGRAQAVQARAARMPPSVHMNPVLLKPETDTGAQVIVQGKRWGTLRAQNYLEKKAALLPAVLESFAHLARDADIVLVEGAGSPAEINLRETDLANMRTAKTAAARVVLVADIDRGGAFAHLYGTWALLPEDERTLIAGFVLNKFRGDPSLLPPAPEQLEALTGVPTLGVLPWLEHGLPDEDGAATPRRLHDRRSVAVVRYPTASNLDEFKQLEQVADLRWAARPEEIEGADLLILPGSKHVGADLAWLARTGLAEAVRKRARSGHPVLGICGGMQMLGRRIEDAAGVDGSGEGLGLLPLRTAFARSKQTEKTSTRFRPLPEPWSALGEKTLTGYQIRHGQTRTTAAVAEALPDGLGFVDGPVLGIYLHGLFEQPELLEGLFGEPPRRLLDQAFDELADAVEEHLDVPALLHEVRVA